MNRRELTKLSEQELFEFYCENANKFDKLTGAADFKSSNLAHANLGRAYSEISARGLHDRLLPLLESGQDGVRMWSAMYMLLSMPEKAEPVLLTLTKRSGIAAHHPRMILDLWRRGELKYD